MDEKSIFQIFDTLILNSNTAISKNEVPVSCAFVKYNEGTEDYEILTMSHNLTNKSKNATKHCELNCLETLHLNDYSQVYVLVTVEPCLMCGYALVLVQTKKVYYILPNQKFGGVESLFKLDLNTQKIDYRTQFVRGQLQAFYEGGNPNLEEAQRHRYRKVKEGQNSNRKKIKEN